MSKQMNLPQVIRSVLKDLESAGFEAYAVGGCVRDHVMGAVPKDYDITTSARPEQVMSVFDGDKVIETGLKHGTVTLVREGENIEITTFRTDGVYSDSRHPDSVSFSDRLEDDLSRRDFTCNAMAYSEAGGIVDPFGGMEDIAGRRIASVGDARRRFGEDALRIMRALRFSSVLGFEIEEKTAEAIHDLRNNLRAVSGERIAVELRKLLCGERCVEVLREYPDVIGVFIDDFEKMQGFDQRSVYHDRDLLEHTLATVENVPPVFELRIAALLHDIGKLDCFTIDENGRGHFRAHPVYSCRRAEKLFRRLHLSNKEKDEIIRLIHMHDIRFSIKESTVRRYVGKYGREYMLRLTQLMRADAIAHKAEDLERNLQEVEWFENAVITASQRPCLSAAELAINGNDLIMIGCERGPRMGEVLDALLDLVLRDEIQNTPSQLLAAAKRMIGKDDQ